MTTIKCLLCAAVLSVSVSASAVAKSGTISTTQVGTISTTKAGTISTTKAGTISTTGAQPSLTGTISTTRSDSYEAGRTRVDVFAFFALLFGTW